ncbi:MAG: hypothetical protein WA053_01990, partial [Minisyncoccia bacterium]
MMRLLDVLFPPRVDEKILRSITDDGFLALISPQLVPCTRPGTAVLFPFSEESVRATIHEAKYRGSQRAFDLLSLALTEYLRDADDASRNTIIIPVPLGKMRRKERGFNQVEEIAKRAAANLGIPVDTTLLERTRETVSQVTLPRGKREENMRGAFGAAHPANPAYTYILIDDVTTTG